MGGQIGWPSTEVWGPTYDTKTQTTYITHDSMTLTETYVPAQLVRTCIIKQQSDKETVVQPVRAWSKQAEKSLYM